MDFKIKNGDWVEENGKIVLIDGEEAVLSQIQTLLTTKRNEFYPDKNFGSDIMSISREQQHIQLQKALAYARKCCASMENVHVDSVRMKGGRMVFKIVLKDEEREVEVAWN